MRERDRRKKEWLRASGVKSDRASGLGNGSAARVAWDGRRKKEEVAERRDRGVDWAAVG